MDNKKPRTSWSYYEYVDAYNNLEDENAKLREALSNLYNSDNEVDWTNAMLSAEQVLKGDSDG